MSEEQVIHTPTEEELLDVFREVEQPVTKLPEKATAEEQDESQEPEEEVVVEEEIPIQLEIDYDQQIPMPDGHEPMTLGEMKDKVTELDRSQSQLEAVRTEIMQKEQLMAQYVQKMGGEIPQEFVREAEQDRLRYLQKQQEVMLHTIPEWQDNNQFTIDKPKVIAAGKSLGYSEAELSQIADARLVLGLKRLADYEAKERKAQETVQQIHAKSKPKGKKPKANTASTKLDKLVNAAVRSRNDDVKIEAIDNLLK